VKRPSGGFLGLRLLLTLELFVKQTTIEFCIFNRSYSLPSPSPCPLPQWGRGYR
jgi:hypothetical protein